jgi:hypothetical protein
MCPIGIISYFISENKPEDTNGCILVGLKRQQDFVNNSKRAMDLLMKKIIHLGGKKYKLNNKNKK